MSMNRFGVDRLDETRRARLKALKGKPNRTPLEDGELTALAMSGGHTDRQWLETNAPMSRQAATMAGGRQSSPSTTLTEAQVKRAIEKGLQPVLDRLRDLED